MSSPASSRERRRHPRVRANCAVNLVLAEGPFRANLRDISISGMCFHLDRGIPEMTRLDLDLELPHQGEVIRIRGEGVVVRSERISAAVDHFEIAVFFHSLRDSDRERLETYCSAHAA